MTKTFKFEKGDTVVGHNLPLEILDMGFRNKTGYTVYASSISTSEFIFYLKLGTRIIKLQSADGKLTGIAHYFEVFKK